MLTHIFKTRNLKTRKCDRVDQDVRQWLTDSVLHVMNSSLKLLIEKRCNIVHVKYIK